MSKPVRPSIEKRPTIGYRLIHASAKAPARAHDHDAGWDVCSTQERLLAPGDVWTAPLGVVCRIPPGWMIEVRPRSGLAAKHGVTILNAPGTVDAGYQGEMMAVLVNQGRESFRVTVGMRVAQFVPQRVPEIAFVLEETPEQPTARGARGWGSTGA